MDTRGQTGFVRLFQQPCVRSSPVRIGISVGARSARSLQSSTAAQQTAPWLTIVTATPMRNAPGFGRYSSCDGKNEVVETLIGFPLNHVLPELAVGDRIRASPFAELLILRITIAGNYVQTFSEL
jgi:hypothetical protein